MLANTVVTSVRHGVHFAEQWNTAITVTLLQTLPKALPHQSAFVALTLHKWSLLSLRSQATASFSLLIEGKVFHAL